MSPRRALLVEVVDAIGAHPEDGLARERALALAGVSAEAVAIGTLHGPHAAQPPGRVRIACGPQAVVEALERERPDLVLVAAAERGSAADVRRLSGDLPMLWWPTGVSARERRRFGRLPLAPLALGSGDDAHAAGLELAAAAPARRPPLPLWDGDHVVAAGPLAGGSGRALLRAFARVAQDYGTLELVVLADPQPEFARIARAAGISARVHFAGPATREAERAWYAAAAAVLVGSQRAISAGLVMRALGLGTPLLAIGRGSPADPLRVWLARHACAWSALDADPADALLRALDRGPAVRRAIAAGRTLVAARTVRSLGNRLAAALGTGDAPLREAA